MEQLSSFQRTEDFYHGSRTTKRGGVPDIDTPEENGD